MLFARRSLQRLLDGLDEKVSLEARRKIAHEIDRRNSSALGYEWELALLHALTQVGDVAYEPIYESGPSHPDFAFASKDRTLHFVADVTTVSDAGLDKENPMERFSQGIHRLRAKYGLKGSLDLKVSGVTACRHHRNLKTKLKLPKINEIEPFLQSHVSPHFARIAKERLTKDIFMIRTAEVEFTVSYDETKKFSGGSYPSYTATQSLTRNPVASALKAKLAQLKAAGTNEPLGIFLCDGGCQLLAQHGHRHMQIGRDEVIADFFRQNSSLAFVVVLLFPPSQRALGRATEDLRITGHVYANHNAASPVPGETLLSLLNQGLAALPQPIVTPRDALGWIDDLPPHTGRSLSYIKTGSGRMSTSVTMSARKALEILAGQITADEHFEHHPGPAARGDNPIARAIKMGMTLESIHVTKMQDIDDDELVLRFGPPDPAISKFKVGKMQRDE